MWAIRHPASGYVQGINDLATPFFQVFLSAYIDADPETFDPGLLPPSVLNAVEADTFWCLSRLLDGIQDPQSKKVATELVVLEEGDKARTFWKAEDYHQDYLENNPGGYECPTHKLWW